MAAAWLSSSGRRRGSSSVLVVVERAAPAVDSPSRAAGGAPPRRTLRRWRPAGMLLLLVVVVFVAVFVVLALVGVGDGPRGTLRAGAHDDHDVDHEKAGEGERLTAYEWAPWVARESPVPLPGEWVPQLVDYHGRDLLVPVCSSCSLDQVHREGHLHLGAALLVVDQHDHVLITERSPTMITCPGAYVMVGEHAAPGEDWRNPEAVAERAIAEELVPALSSLSGDDDDPAKMWEQHLVELTDLFGGGGGGAPAAPRPFYYDKDYGPELDFRRDRQLTYFWYAKLDAPGELLVPPTTRRPVLSGDKPPRVLEAAGNPHTHRLTTSSSSESLRFLWVSLEDLGRWLEERPGDFCDPSIHHLMRMSYEGLLTKRHQP